MLRLYPVKEDFKMCTQQKFSFVKICYICMLYICIESYHNANNESDMTKCDFYFLTVTQKSNNCLKPNIWIEVFEEGEKSKLGNRENTKNQNSKKMFFKMVFFFRYILTEYMVCLRISAFNDQHQDIFQENYGTLKGKKFFECLGKMSKWLNNKRQVEEQIKK